MNRVNRFIYCVVACTAATAALPAKSQPQQKPGAIPSISWIRTMPTLIGRPLIGTAIDISNRNRIVLETLTPAGATFLFGSKEPGESADALRRRASLSILLGTCEGNTSLDAPISSASIWEELDDDESKKAATVLKELLELAGGTAQITTPSLARAPRVANFTGVAFEYVQGSKVITVGLINDGDARGKQMVNWTLVDPSLCKK